MLNFTLANWAKWMEAYLILTPNDIKFIKNQKKVEEIRQKNSSVWPNIINTSVPFYAHLT